MTLIKVCGITAVEDALETARLGADIIGLVFAESQRRVSLQQAEEISLAVRKLKHRPAVAGIFVNESPQYVNDTSCRCRLDVVQLSGEESPGYCLNILFPLIKVIHVEDNINTDCVANAVKQIEGIKSGWQIIPLLDSRRGVKYGGTGETFSRDIAKQICAAFPVMVAGGLTPVNVGGLIDEVRPLGVDVSSGVETSGRKDMAKIHSFIEAVRSADHDPGNRDLIEKYILEGEQNVA
jgi:phosphoribosylanthranilate isomerase